MRNGESRRRHPRIEVDGSLGVLDVSCSEWVSIRNVSEGGFQTLSRARPKEGDVHTFKAVLGRELVSFMATAVYVRVARISQRTRWLAGWKASEDRQTVKGIAALIASATDVHRLTQSEHEPLSVTLSEESEV